MRKCKYDQNYILNGPPGSLSSITQDLSMNNYRIVSVTDPTNPQDVATKQYVDSRQPTIPTISQDANFGGYKITNLGDPVNSEDATNKKYVDDGLQHYVTLFQANQTYIRKGESRYDQQKDNFSCRSCRWKRCCEQEVGFRQRSWTKTS